MGSVSEFQAAATGSKDTEAQAICPVRAGSAAFKWGGASG